MSLARNVLIGAAVLGIAVFLSGVSFADEGCHKGKMGHEAKIKLLKDSAAALEKSNPDLAKGLEEMTEFKNKSKMNEKEEAAETVEPKSEQGETK